MWEFYACILDGRNRSHPLNFEVDPGFASRQVLVADVHLLRCKVFEGIVGVAVDAAMACEFWRWAWIFQNMIITVI